MDWVEQLVAKLQFAPDGVLTVDMGDGKVTSVTITPDILQFFVTNKDLLARLGKDTFKAFLLLVNEKKQEQAFQLVLAQMTANDIIDRMNQNAGALQQANDDHDKFMAALWNFVLKTLAPAALKLVISLLMA